MFRTFRECCLLPEKQMRSHCSIIILLQRLSNPYRCKDMVALFERNPTELRLIFTLDFIYQRHYQTRVIEFIFCSTAIFTGICRCSSWKRCTFIELFWLCLWNNCLYLQAKGWRMAATQEYMV